MLSLVQDTSDYWERYSFLKIYSAAWYGVSNKYVLFCLNCISLLWL